MDWVKWIIPLIAIVVWIVTNLMNGERKGPNNAQKRSGSAPVRRPNPQEQARARRSPEDLNRLIEEARQRQRDAERNKQLDVQRRRPAETAPRKPRNVEVVRREVPATLLIEPPPPPRMVEAIPPATVEKVAIVQMPPPVLGIVNQATIGKDSARKKIRELLNSRDSLKAAMILREVLEPPLSRRRRS